MKKLIRLFAVAAVAMAVAACGGNTTTENNEANATPAEEQNGTPEKSVTEQTNPLVKTSWHYLEGDELMMDPYIDRAIDFKATNCFYWVNDHRQTPAKRVSGYGTYTFDEATGKGSANLKDQNNDKPMGEATFTLNGNELQFTFEGQTYKMTKR